jgi:hypothetical protein
MGILMARYLSIYYLCGLAGMRSAEHHKNAMFSRTLGFGGYYSFETGGIK